MLISCILSIANCKAEYIYYMDTSILLEDTRLVEYIRSLYLRPLWHILHLFAGSENVDQWRHLHTYKHRY